MQVFNVVLKANQLQHKTVLLRVDYNVPIKDGKILDDSRIRASLPTIKLLLGNRSRVVIISHFGRPKGVRNPEMSLSFVPEKLRELLPGVNVVFSENVIGEEVIKSVHNLKDGEILVLENIRFYPEEEKNDLEFARRIASLGDAYINDSFSSSHRAHASIEAITRYLPSAAGMLLQSEVETLAGLLTLPKEPMMAIVGGSKVSTKIDLLKSLCEKVHYLVIGGAMANSFLYATGKVMGKSFYEKDAITIVHDIMDLAEEEGCELILPIDAVVAKELKDGVETRISDLSDIKEDEMILDVGPKTIDHIHTRLNLVKTLIWNGPLGAFEFTPFNDGTSKVAEEVSALTKSGKLISVAGGGDINAALKQCHYDEDFTYLSTAGGAFLEWLEGKNLPGIAVLDTKISQ